MSTFSKIKNSSQILTNISVSPTMREILQKERNNPNAKFLVYTRKRTHERSIDLPITLVHIQ